MITDKQWFGDGNCGGFLHSAAEEFGNGSIESVPGWYREYFSSCLSSRKDAERLNYTIEEFAGRFSYSIERALFEARDKKLFGVCSGYFLDLPPSKTYVPAVEVDRYAAILETEKQQPKQPQTKKHRDPSNPKSQNTLLQMIAVMAIKGYKYNPDDIRSTVPATIVNSAQSMGIALDQKTVREWLQQAAEYSSSEE